MEKTLEKRFRFLCLLSVLCFFFLPFCISYSFLKTDYFFPYLFASFFALFIGLYISPFLAFLCFMYDLLSFCLIIYLMPGAGRHHLRGFSIFSFSFPPFFNGRITPFLLDSILREMFFFSPFFLFAILVLHRPIRDFGGEKGGYDAF